MGDGQLVADGELAGHDAEPPDRFGAGVCTVDLVDRGLHGAEQIGIVAKLRDGGRCRLAVILLPERERLLVERDERGKVGLAVTDRTTSSVAFAPGDTSYLGAVVHRAWLHGGVPRGLLHGPLVLRRDVQLPQQLTTKARSAVPAAAGS